MPLNAKAVVEAAHAKGLILTAEEARAERFSKAPRKIITEVPEDLRVLPIAPTRGPHGLLYPKRPPQHRRYIITRKERPDLFP